MARTIISKILHSPFYAIIWMWQNLAESLLLSVFAFSILPFFMHVANPHIFGGVIVFYTCIAKEYLLDNDKTKKWRLYNILLIAIILLGMISMCFLENGFGSISASTDNMLAVFRGGFWGALISHFIISRMDSIREEKKKQKELDRIEYERKQEQMMIAQKEKEGFVAIKREGKLIGYIEKSKYNNFIDNNI